MKCPMRGRRAAELANGEFLKVFQKLADSSAARLVASLTQGLGDADRRRLLQEFNIARTHLFFYFALKLAAWSRYPLRALRLAHSNPQVAKQEMGRVLGLPREFRCPSLQTLQGPLRGQGQRWLDGASLNTDELRELRGVSGRASFDTNM